MRLEPPSHPDRASSFLNIRVAAIGPIYEQWSARGAEFLTPPIDRGGARSAVDLLGTGPCTSHGELFLVSVALAHWIVGRARPLPKHVCFLTLGWGE